MPHTYSEDEDIYYQKDSSAAGIIYLIIVLIWILLGIAAFFASLICFVKEGSQNDKWIGLLVSIVLGPFYWFYFIFNRGYCSSKKSSKKNS